MKCEQSFPTPTAKTYILRSTLAVLWRVQVGSSRTASNNTIFTFFALRVLLYIIICVNISPVQRTF